MYCIYIQYIRTKKMTTYSLIPAAKTLSNVRVPLFTESCAAGFPSPAQDYVEASLDLNDLCIRHRSATYQVRRKTPSFRAGI